MDASGAPLGPELVIDRVSKTHRRAGGMTVPVLDDFSLTASTGELVVLFGPNGSGKTTLLNLISGLNKPDAGSIRLPARSAGAVGYVFQNYAESLLPWRSVEGNVRFPLELEARKRNARASEESTVAEKIAHRLMELGLAEHASKPVYALSGGLKQLTAIAQATIYDPAILLLDEPFSALDHSRARVLWPRFRAFWRSNGLTGLFVSHNVDEAVFLADRIVVLSPRPARVVADIVIDLPDPRHPDLLSSPNFLAARTRVLEAFQAAVTKT